MNRVEDIYNDLLKTYKDLNIEYHKKVDIKSPNNLWIGITEDKLPYFMFESEYLKSASINIKSCSGFQIKKNANPKDKKIEAVYIISKNTSNNEVFYTVIQDLVDIAFLNTNKVIDYLVERLQSWITFFRISSDGVLPFKTQVGLFGELYFIEALLLKDLFSVINTWKGPLAATKDFIFGNSAVEVKSTIQSDYNRIQISDEYQLDDTGFKELYLKFILLYEDSLNGRSIPDIVEQILLMLIYKPDLKAKFNELLMKVGYTEKFNYKYHDYFSVGSEYQFKIKDKSPRLIPSILEKGINHVSYSVDVSAYLDFQVDNQLFIDTLVKEIQK